MIGADVLFTDAEYECHGNGTTLRLKPKRLNDTNGISKTGSPPTRATHCYVILQQNANGRLIHCILNLKHVDHDLSRGKTCPVSTQLSRNVDRASERDVDGQNISGDLENQVKNSLRTTI